MATKQLVTKVWIEPGCIVCDACETAAPDVFEVQEDTCIVRPAALKAEFNKPRTQSIIDAAEECPVDVIKFETTESEVTEEAPAGPVPATVTVAAAPAAPKHKLAELAKAKPTKSPEAPVPMKAAEHAPAAVRVAASAPKTSMAGEPDPAIAALLRAATSRGGGAMIMKREESISATSQALKSKDPSELPPDARQAKILAAAGKAKQDPTLQRRAFMSSAALGAGWIAFGFGTGVAAGPAFMRFMMPNVLEEPDPLVRVGKFQRYLEMKPGEVNEDYKPQGIWIIRDGDKIAALSIICTHLGCIPNWLPNDRKFKCPCHGSGYKPNGINFEGPTPRPLERFRVYVEDGVLVVDKSRKYQSEKGQWDYPGSFIGV